MDYKAIIEELQILIDKPPFRIFYMELIKIVKKLEKSDDIKILKVVAKYKKLISDLGDPFDWKKVEPRNPSSENDIIELTIKLIDYLNDYFGFLKPFK